MATTVKNSSSGRSDEALRRIHQNWMRRGGDLPYLSKPYSDLTDEEFFALRSNLQGELREEMLDDISLRDFMRPKDPVDLLYNNLTQSTVSERWCIAHLVLIWCGIVLDEAMVIKMIHHRNIMDSLLFSRVNLIARLDSYDP
uniref:Uncharacterized protein n=1 Tax=Ananas comosus var. bracteatus TaxID=296719 RepID=A0A6V7QTM5_ANACO